MGFFGRYVYDSSRWMSWSDDSLPELAEPWLWIDIHDSDITTVCYRPSGAATGAAYLGCTPRTYFDNEDASPPTDVSREATGLAEWWACRQGSASEAEVDAKRREIQTYLADDEDPGEIEYHEDVDALDDAEIFVEVKTARFLNALGLPVPDDLPR